jgi:hypothetical protein
MAGGTDTAGRPYARLSQLLPGDRVEHFLAGLTADDIVVGVYFIDRPERA